jgi:hypothetical protein
MAMGYRHVESGPLVRSSYHAEEQVSLGTVGSHQQSAISHQPSTVNTADR